MPGTLSKELRRVEVMHNFNLPDDFNLKAPMTHDNLESTAQLLWEAESLHDVIRRGILMPNFSAAIRGEKIYVKFGGEQHMYDRPDDEAIQRIVNAFKPEAKPDDMPLSPLRVDEASMDG